jgi:hypothetical protein
MGFFTLSGTGETAVDATEKMSILADTGNVGIGTTSPDQKLMVNISTTSGVNGTVLNSYPIAKFINTDSGNAQRGLEIGANTGSVSSPIYLKVSGTSARFAIVNENNVENFTILSAGNVGIGTSSPGAKLDVDTVGTAGVGFIAKASSLSSSQVNIGVSVVTAGRPFIGTNTSTNPLEIGTRASVDMLFLTNTTERARITSGGTLLIGRSNPDVDGVGIRFDGDGGSYHSIPTGGGTLYVRNTTDTAYRFYVSASGTVFAANTTISSISDRRVKENIVDLDVGLNEIMELKPRKFDWKTGKGKGIKNDRGFIAQEFETVFPDLIDTWKDEAPEGEEPYKSLRADLIPVIVKALQELKADNDALRARLAALESK